MNPANLDEALSRIQSELIGLLRKPVLDAEIFRAVTGIESSEFYGLETADGLARKVGSLTTLLGDPSEFEKYLKRVEAFDSKMARAMTLKYLDPSRAHVVAFRRGAAGGHGAAADEWGHGSAADVGGVVDDHRRKRPAGHPGGTVLVSCAFTRTAG
jgi:hypothetical protein